MTANFFYLTWIMDILPADNISVDIRCIYSFQFCMEYLTHQLIEGHIVRIPH